MQKMLQTSLANHIRLDKLDNPYIKGSHGLSSEKINTPSIHLMQCMDGIPLPINKRKKAGDILAMARLKCRKTAWNLSLNMPEIPSSADDYFHQCITFAITEQELELFKCHSDAVMDSFSEKSPLINFQRSTRAGIKKTFKSKDGCYSAWALRAYLTGHRSALNTAMLAHSCQLMNKGLLENDAEKQRLDEMIAEIQKHPELFKFKKTHRRSILKELAYRFHTLAIQQDIIALQHYLDFYQYSYSQRAAPFHKKLIEGHGMTGRTLIDCMLCEEKYLPFQFKFAFEALPGFYSENKASSFTSLATDCLNYGDKTYYKKSDSPLLDRLLNGMDNSIGDLCRTLLCGTSPRPAEFGALLYLPEIDHDSQQTMPLILMHQNKLFLRRQIHAIRLLSQEDFKQLTQNPAAFGYKPLTHARAFRISLQWRMLHFVLSEQQFNPQQKEKKLSNLMFKEKQ